MAVVAAIVVLCGVGTLALVVWRSVAAARPAGSSASHRDDLDHL